MNILPKLALSFVLIATVFLLSGCVTKQDMPAPKVLDNLAIQQELKQKIEDLDAQNKNFDIPAWVSELNIVEPKGMKLDKTKSHQSSTDIEGFNSIHFVYDGDYNVAIKQAELIAQKANIPVSPEFKMAQKLSKSLSTGNDMQKLIGDMKGMVYANYNLFDMSKVHYAKTITVNEDGSLEIDITDIKAMEEITKKTLEE